MDSPQKKLGSTMDGKDAMAARLLRDEVLRGSAWALVTACAFLICYAVGSVVAYAVCGQLLPIVPKDSAIWIWIGLMCCAPLQAAAAVLALLLPCHRRRIRRALAYLAVTVAIAGHCMLASSIPLAADPGLGYLLWLVLRILCASGICILMACDLLCFLELLVGMRNHDLLC